MIKKLQKGLKDINIDPEYHIIYKKTNLKLVVLRPNDLAQMGDLIGQGNKDIITWIGKTVGRNIAEIVDKSESPKNKNDLIVKSCKNLENLGFGILTVENYHEGKAMDVRVENPLYRELDENQDIISTIYVGLFLGILEYVGYQAQGVEIEAAWKNKEINHSLYQMTIGEVARSEGSQA
jgi:hypothetical protein